MWDFITSIFPYVLATTAPLLVTAIGGFFSEKSGVVNIGLEGLMVVGGFVSAIFISEMTYSIGYTPQYIVWLGILVGALAGGIFSLLHAFASISLKADQVISGTAINLLAASLTVFFARTLTGSQNIQLVSGVKRYSSLPVLGDIPILGPLFFQTTYLTTYVVLAIVIISWYVVYKTPFGLRLRACGEHPHAADSMGINVYRIRYISVFLSGILSGLGGALFVTVTSQEFNGTVSGIGFLALATLIFGQWNPWKVLGASLFFGFMQTLGSFAPTNELLKTLPINDNFYNMLPYVMTLIVLVIFSRNSQAPKANGEAYDAGKR